MAAAAKVRAQMGVIDGFDPARVVAMLDVLAEPDVISFASEYAQESARHIAELSAAIEAVDLERARRAAHTLKAAGGLFGAYLLERRCHVLEIAAINGRLPTEDEVVEVSTLRDRSVAALEKMLGAL